MTLFSRATMHTSMYSGYGLIPQKSECQVPLISPLILLLFCSRHISKFRGIKVFSTKLFFPRIAFKELEKK